MGLVLAFRSHVWLAFVSLLIPAAALAAAAPSPLAVGRPNIVLAISDDQDYEHLGFAGGNPLARTPNLDEIAKGGVVFPVATTQPRCRPALAGLLSGRWPHQVGIYTNFGKQQLDRANLMPALLRDAGYATYVQGKLWEGAPASVGFTAGPGRDPEFVRRDQTALFQFLEREGRERPFFVWWAPRMPHVPHTPPPSFVSLFPPSSIGYPGYLGENWQTSAFKVAEARLLAMTAWMDAGFGALVDKLRTLGLLENTLIIFLIDNGWANGLPSKGTAFDKGVRTPLVFYWKGAIRPASIDVLGSYLDVAPTILDYAGVAIPSSYSGMSLRPLIEGKGGMSRDLLVDAVYPGYAGEDPARDLYALYVRDSRWKYILYTRDVVQADNEKFLRIQHRFCPFPARKKGDEDLFDLRNDRYERTSLARLPEHRGRLQRMRQQALDWWASTGGVELSLSFDQVSNDLAPVPTPNSGGPAH